jgi:hypothetical protein
VSYRTNGTTNSAIEGVQSGVNEQAEGEGEVLADEEASNGTYAV